MKKLHLLLTVASALTVLSCSDKSKTADQSADNLDLSSGIVLHYDFEDAQDGLVKDLGPNHADARLMGGATVTEGNLVLGASDDYLDMTEAAGRVLQGLADFTISTSYCVDSTEVIEGYGYFLWCFSALEANAEKEGPYHAYRLNEQRCETSIGGWSQETGVQKGAVAEVGCWTSVIFRQVSGKGELFINGQLIASEEGFPEHKTNFAAAPSFNWMGRAPFNGDKYLANTKIADFRLYDRGVSDEEVAELAALCTSHS